MWSYVRCQVGAVWVVGVNTGLPCACLPAEMQVHGVCPCGVLQAGVTFNQAAECSVLQTLAFCSAARAICRSMTWTDADGIPVVAMYSEPG